MSYLPNQKRYDGALFRRCGRSGIVLPPVSLGLWQNFGGADVFETGRAMVRRAFDRGVTHSTSPITRPALWLGGRELRRNSAQGFRRVRDELVISQSRMGYVAGTLRHRRIAQVSAGLAR